MPPRAQQVAVSSSEPSNRADPRWRVPLGNRARQHLVIERLTHHCAELNRKRAQDVTYEDQQKINTFSRLNVRVNDFKARMATKRAAAEDLEEAGNEVMLLDDETVPFMVGECVVHLPREDVEERLTQREPTTVAPGDATFWCSMLLRAALRVTSLAACLRCTSIRRRGPLRRACEGANRRRWHIRTAHLRVALCCGAANGPARGAARC